MTISAVTHINFHDAQARDALGFSADVFNGEVLVHTDEEFSMPPPSAAAHTSTTHRDRAFDDM